MTNATSIELEREASLLWKAKNAEQMQPIVEALLFREFCEYDLVRTLQGRELANILKYSQNEVPYYRDHPDWGKLNLNRGSVRRTLKRLPILSKNDVQENVNALQASRLIKTQKTTWTQSSGTTGRPTRVRFNQQSISAFGLFIYRLLRWHRYDPTTTLAIIRQPKDLPKNKQGQKLEAGQVHRSTNWMYLGNWFHTGPMVAFGRNNSVESQIDFLRNESPDYLVTYPGTLETLIYACQGKPVDSIKGLRTISAMLTEGMRSQIESASALSVLQNYGLNEIGIVANRCEAGRYHVNAEHCFVEIVNDDGRTCKNGETGRLLVTALTNLAMPLIRYDTGDLAEAVRGPCSCGRTLPSIGKIVGRYRAMRYTPDGTPKRVNLVTESIEKLPLSVLSGLRQYQLHQYHDNKFELRLKTNGKPNQQLISAINNAWDIEANEGTPLSIIHVDDIPASSGGKQQEFTSDFFPSIDEEAKKNNDV